MEQNSRRLSGATDPDRYERIKSILKQYPNIAPEEDAEVLNYLRNGPMLDTALLSGAHEVQEQLVRFRAYHERDFAIGFVQWVVAAVMLISIAAAAYFLWDIGV